MNEYHLDAITPSWISTAYLLASAVLLVPIGRLADIHRRKKSLLAGTALFSLASFAMALIPCGSTPLWYILASLVMLGVGFGLFSLPNINVIMSSMEAKYLGVASGMNGTTRLVGQTFSMGIAMMLFAILLGPVVISPSNYPQFATSMHYAFVIFLAFCLVGIGASLIRGRSPTWRRTGIHRGVSTGLGYLGIPV
jgi:MFS family permease